MNGEHHASRPFNLYSFTYRRVCLPPSSHFPYTTAHARLTTWPLGTLKAPTTNSDSDLFAHLRLNTLMLRRLSSNPQLSFERLLSFTYNHACIVRAICVSLTDVGRPSLRPRNVNATPKATSRQSGGKMLGHFRGRSSTAPGSIDNTHRSILFGQPNASHPTPILDVL
jgi:hypothetical protein